MRQLDDFFASPLDRTLFHYTGIESLVGIDRSSSLWASHIYYLNDAKEITHACDILRSAIEPNIVFGGLTTQEKTFAEQFQAWSQSFYGKRYCLFVFSLSEERSQLSQWRSYTPHGRGVSIEFSPDTLRRLAGEQFRLARCVYSPNEQKAILSGLFAKLLTTFRNEHPIPGPPNPAGTEYFQFLERFRGEVLQVLALLKHKAFEEEKEWRLISEYFPSFASPIVKFRPGASLLVPYIEIPIGARRPYFESITLGPSQHEELSFDSLHMFLSNSNLAHVTHNSRIPYREW